MKRADLERLKEHVDQLDPHEQRQIFHIIQTMSNNTKLVLMDQSVSVNNGVIYLKRSEWTTYFLNTWQIFSLQYTKIVFEVI